MWAWIKHLKHNILKQGRLGEEEFEDEPEFWKRNKPQ